MVLLSFSVSTICTLGMKMGNIANSILSQIKFNKNMNIISRANDEKVQKKLYLAGANDVIAENEIASLVATEYLGQPIAFDAIDDICVSIIGIGINLKKINTFSINDSAFKYIFIFLPFYLLIFLSKSNYNELFCFFQIINPIIANNIMIRIAKCNHGIT